jgi:hypothetical protein
MMLTRREVLAAFAGVVVPSVPAVAQRRDSAAKLKVVTLAVSGMS